ncbi:CoA pyrophosphatase [Pseudoprimorskyibacter insulae]|uniref:Putative Nudix hydrolase NudL n=1 Tax=Pseudoprimorskyibacter insulae TaxID=1695997 RepID=A0A2R8ATK1_9RHOB|nr:CoA pyrophosphatase [Pseudoprimorskyibacter insulae]SPF79355.1 putative Nudix hydrolase NudL [Pseudoprimorskyibacter insulae]
MTDIASTLRRAIAHGGDGSSDFDLNPTIKLPAGRKLRPAGVLVPIDLTGPVPQVILTKRSSRLKHHPGQIAFPGGKVDDGDADATAAALREAREEIGLPEHVVEVLGDLPTHETVSSFVVTPVIGLIHARFDERPEAGEVEEVFRVPLSHALDQSRYSVQSRRWQGQMRHYYTAPFGPYYIWGATARILRGLVSRMAQ